MDKRNEWRKRKGICGKKKKKKNTTIHKTRTDKWAYSSARASMVHVLGNKVKLLSKMWGSQKREMSVWETDRDWWRGEMYSVHLLRLGVRLRGTPSTFWSLLVLVLVYNLVRLRLWDHTYYYSTLTHITSFWSIIGSSCCSVASRCSVRADCGVSTLLIKRTDHRGGCAVTEPMGDIEEKERRVQKRCYTSLTL